MERLKLENLFNSLKDREINDLYMFSCLMGSGFDKYNSYKLIDTLRDLWLKDENDFGISKLSDMLFDVYEEIEDKDMTTREILQRMYDEVL